MLSEKFCALVNRADATKLSHLRFDFGAATLHAAKLLDSAADAGLLPDWQRERSRFRNAKGLEARFYEWLLGSSEDERACRLWTFAVQGLVKKNPDAFCPEAAQFDWPHYRQNPAVAPIITYFSLTELNKMPGKQREALKRATEKLRSEGKLPPGTRIMKRWKLPPEASVADESAFGEPDGDESDSRHRLKLRTEVYATACGLLANSIDARLQSGKTEFTESSTQLEDWNVLTDRQRDSMRALLEMNAVDADSRRTANNIAVKAEGCQANVEGFKEPLADLVHQGLLKSKKGSRGGYWLSQSGRNCVRAHENPPL